MKGDSRVQKSMQNAYVSTICFFVSLLISFFSRKIFLDQLGASFMGLSGTLGSLLGFLNIAELGIGTAIGYVLYKPIAESDEFTIKEIVSVLGYLYRWIGNIIFVLGFLLSIALPFIFKEEPFSSGVIFLGFYAYLFSSLIGYYNNYKQVLLSADQRNYEVTGYYQIIISVMTLLQMAFALYSGNYYIFFILQLLCGVFYSILLNYRIKKVYPWLKTNITSGKKLLKHYPDIKKYIKQIFVHKIGGFVQFELSPFLVYSFVSLPMVAIYTNYTILTDKLMNLIQGVLDSTLAGVGNLISEGDSDRIWSVYRQLLSVRLFVVGVSCSCFYFLSSGFINLWLGHEYVLPSTTILLITITLFLRLARGTTEQFINGFGLFYDIWSPIAEASIFVAASICFGSIWGLNGILLGPIFSMAIIIHMWKPFFLFKKGLKRNFWLYIYQLTISIVSIVICYLVCSWLISLACIEINNWIKFILHFLLFVTSYSLVLFSIFYTISTDFRMIVKDIFCRLFK